MTTDNKAAYTMYPCLNCTSVNTINQTDGCKSLGLQMAVPRSQNHWSSMFSFVGTTLNADIPVFFQVLPGIYSPVSTTSPSVPVCANSYINSGNCSATATLRSIDGGKWWVRGTSGTIANGNGYTANCFLGLYAYSTTQSPGALLIQSKACLFYSGTSYLCSTNDDSLGGTSCGPG